MPSRPNILIIKSDQHNARCLGVNGHRQVKTPNLDALAGGGVNFTQAFVQNPICTPSRMSYLTGQYVHNHGIYGLSIMPNPDDPIPPTLPTFIGVLKAEGYRTGIIGHIHVRKDWLAPHCDMYRDLHENTEPYDPYYLHNPYSQYLAGKGLLEKRDDEAYKGKVQILDACPSELAFQDSYEGYCAQSFEEFLSQTPPDQPFVYQIDALHPHQDYIPAREFWDLYEGVDLELPPSANEDLSGKPPHQQSTAAWGRQYEGVFEPKGYEHVRRRKLRGYYGCISQVDHMVGLVRTMLRQRGLEQNTLIVYCADHGDFALEHGFLEKAPGISYDAILRTPFIWSWPLGRFVNRTVQELVESVDVFPTLCKLAGLAVPDTADGKDISDMLRGKARPIRDFVVAEFPLSRTIRTREWKLCHRPRGMFGDGKDHGELYHVAEDPWEMKNLYHDPRFWEIREDLRRTLFDWTQMTTRYPNVWPHAALSADNKVPLTKLKEMLDKGIVNYL